MTSKTEISERLKNYGVIITNLDMFPTKMLKRVLEREENKKMIEVHN
jgi:hypothetical protein